MAVYGFPDKQSYDRMARAVRAAGDLPGDRGAMRIKDVQRRVLLGKTDAAHAKGATGTISIYTGTTKGSETDSGRDITGVYNRFADLETGKWVLLHWVAGGWELIAGEC